MSSRFAPRRFPALLSAGFVALLLAVGGLPAGAQVEGPSQATFAFAPTDGAKWIYTIEDERISDFAGKAPRREQLTLSEMDYTYEARPDGTWRVSIVPLSAQMMIDGREIVNPALDLAIGEEVGLILEAGGVATQAEGFRSLFRKYERELDPASFGRLRESTNATSMGNSQVAQWNLPHEDLRGETVEIGEVWAVEDVVSMQGRPVPVEGVIRFAAWTEIDGMRGLKIEYDYDTAGEAAAAVASEVSRALSRRTADTRGAQTNVTIRGSVTRVIVPETGQLLYWTKAEESEVPMGQLDGPRAVFTVKQTYRFRPASR